MAGEITKWTLQLKKAEEMLALLAKMRKHGRTMDIDEASQIAGSILDLAKDLEKEVIRLHRAIGIKATPDAVDAHLSIYGNAYIFRDRLLSPVSMVIKTAKDQVKEIE